jgi:hypothetical protein
VETPLLLSFDIDGITNVFDEIGICMLTGGFNMRGIVGVSLVLLALAAIANAHVSVVYNGLNLPIRGQTAQNIGNGVTEMQGPVSTAGPCGKNGIAASRARTPNLFLLICQMDWMTGGATTFGSSGTSNLAPGELINLQLQYNAGHTVDGGNTFSVAMKCVRGDPTSLGADTTLRLSNAANQVNRVAVLQSLGGINDQYVSHSMPLQLPAKSPAGLELKNGDYCVLSIMDQRDWGNCVDIRVSSNPGPIIAGVLAPVVLIGAAAVIYLKRGPLHAKLLPAAGAANPDRQMWSVIKWTFPAMLFAIISCAAPAWSKGSGWGTGPW